MKKTYYENFKLFCKEYYTKFKVILIAIFTFSGLSAVLISTNFVLFIKILIGFFVLVIILAIYFKLFIFKKDIKYISSTIEISNSTTEKIILIGDYPTKLTIKIQIGGLVQNFYILIPTFGELYTINLNDQKKSFKRWNSRIKRHFIIKFNYEKDQHSHYREEIIQIEILSKDTIYSGKFQIFYCFEEKDNQYVKMENNKKKLHEYPLEIIP